MLNKKIFFKFIWVYFVWTSFTLAKLPEPALTLMGGLFQDVDRGAGREQLSVMPVGQETLRIVAISQSFGDVAIAQLDAAQVDNRVLLRILRDDGTNPRVNDYSLRVSDNLKLPLFERCKIVFSS